MFYHFICSKHKLCDRCQMFATTSVKPYLIPLYQCRNINIIKCSKQYVYYSHLYYNLLIHVIACRNYAYFLYCTSVLTIRLLKRVLFLQTFYSRHHALLDRYDVSIFTMRTDLFNMSQFSFPHLPSLDLTYEQLDWFFQNSKYVYPTWSMLSVFSEVRVAHLILLFCI